MFGVGENELRGSRSFAVRRVCSSARTVIPAATSVPITDEQLVIVR
jgi:hypothetical protein